ncbi:OmpA/MotB family protein [Maridesulfovibrio hydrothermalis]|uniref:OmpA/MotB domain protein n=1 Tax=Maridesulfovibrio hydrothermalis AM13 = DSM 14728 TaxID=1121451 RepID=L0R8E9_9BACT|nr:flagellar motor protein MotB [Maridesulfovibrio hydrothermalis]CCO23038.1 OmpA/MotB domain protein [Maridesulfovibrio hydrothermalis AM13 = DSM 14728]
MARAKKPKIPKGQPGWLITFSDLMTLMLTFFVLLVSMSVVDERRKLVVLGSIIGTFGFGSQGFDVLSQGDSRRTVAVGPMEIEGDLEPIKPLLWEFAEEDLRFESNRFVQILSIGADVLFTPDSTNISIEGSKILDTVLPVLKRVENPVLVAGHTSILRDELGEDYRVEDKDLTPDISWKISLSRSLAVYNYLVRSGMNPEMLKLEAFGKFRPRHSNLNPEGRKMNRRVDLVLDKRSAAVAREIKEYKPPVVKDKPFKFDDFVFPIDGSLEPGPKGQ